jgi:cell division protein FtsQ
MKSIAPVSQAKLTQRRHQLRRQGRRKSFQEIWRSLFVSGLAGGLLWVTIQPFWAIRSSDQIEIEDNVWLTTSAIRSLVPLSYPQSLLTLSPQALAEQLESNAPIAKATVTRQLVPPELSIQVQERQPVAIAVSPGSQYQVPTRIGLLDERGIWMPIDSYNTVNPPLQLPTLKVIGLNKQSRQYWPEVYKAVSHSPVKVLEINWQNPANLIVKTSLGYVHLGAYDSRLSDKFSVLDKMRELPSYMNASEIAYIDLKNPDAPSIQMKKQPSPSSDILENDPVKP